MIMIKKFLFSLVVVLTTFLFATSANAREIASITRTPVMEIPAITANPTSPKQVYVLERLWSSLNIQMDLWTFTTRE